MRAITLALALIACTPSRATREACYAESEAHASRRAFAECRGSWDDCAARPAILEELARAERSCP